MGTPLHVVQVDVGIAQPGEVELKQRINVSGATVAPSPAGCVACSRKYADGQISFAELDASVQGWIAHVTHADTRGLCAHAFETNPIPMVTDTQR